LIFTVKSLHIPNFCSNFAAKIKKQYNTMEKRFIVTIGREFGTGGRKIASELAEMLGVKLYDRQVLEPIREGRQLTQEEVDQIKSVKPSWWYENVSQDLYNEEEQLVRELAEKESCVLLGRTGFHIFRDDERAFKVFLIADKMLDPLKAMDIQGLGAVEINQRHPMHVSGDMEPLLPVDGHRDGVVAVALDLRGKLLELPACRIGLAMTHRHAVIGRVERHELVVPVGEEAESDRHFVEGFRNGHAERFRLFRPVRHRLPGSNIQTRRRPERQDQYKSKKSFHTHTYFIT
jgi:hypothetical protein